VVLNCILSNCLLVFIILSGNIEQAASDDGIARKRLKVKMIQTGVDLRCFWKLFTCLWSSKGSESNEFVKSVCLFVR